MDSAKADRELLILYGFDATGYTRIEALIRYLSTPGDTVQVGALGHASRDDFRAFVVGSIKTHAPQCSVVRIAVRGSPGNPLSAQTVRDITADVITANDLKV